MSTRLEFVGGSGMSVKATVQRLADNYYREDDTETFVSNPAFTDKDIAFTAGTGENVGYYSATLDSSSWNDGLYLYRVHNGSLSNTCIGAQTFYIKDGLDIAYVAETNIYYADINFSKDADSDNYTVLWYKNGTRFTSGVDVTNLKLSVFNRAGIALFTLRAMTNYIDDMGGAVLDITSALELQTTGQNYVAVAYADIDGATRSYAWVLGRDS